MRQSSLGRTVLATVCARSKLTIVIFKDNAAKPDSRSRSQIEVSMVFGSLTPAILCGACLFWKSELPGTSRFFLAGLLKVS